MKTVFVVWLHDFWHRIAVLAAQTLSDLEEKNMWSGTLCISEGVD